VTFLGGSRAIDLVVVNADVNSSEYLFADASIDPEESTEVVVFHEGAWTGPGRKPNAEYVEVANLGFGGAWGGARRVAVFEAGLGWSAPGTAPVAAEDWATDPGLPPLLDVVAFSITGPATWPWEAESAMGEPVLDRTFGDAAWRVFLNHDPADTFRAGPVDADGRIADPDEAVYLEPGLINISRDHTPEPTTLVLMGFAGAALVGRRRASRSP